MAGETKEFREYRKKLEALGGDVLSRVVAETINTVATFAHVGSIKNVRQRFILRTKWTEGSIRYYKANPKKNWTKINAVTGSISDYMDEQEAGGKKLPKKGSKVPVATLISRGGNEKSKKRPRYYLGQVLKGNPKLFIGKPRGEGANSGKQVGIYERKRKKIALIHIIEQPSVTIKATHWHTDAMGDKATQGVIEHEFIRQAKAAIKELGEN